MPAKESSPKPEAKRPRLQREKVVQTALDLMNRIGMDNLSLRRLAEELDVQAPALYWHFENKQELLREMVEAMIMQTFLAVPPPNTEDWVESILWTARTIRKALSSYRDGCKLMVTADPNKASLLGGLDLLLGILVGAGFDHGSALNGIFTMMKYTLGFTFEEENTVPGTDDPAMIQKQLEGAPLPHLREAWRIVPYMLDADAEFEAGLQVIVEGLKAQLQRKIETPELPVTHDD